MAQSRKVFVQEFLLSDVYHVSQLPDVLDPDDFYSNGKLLRDDDIAYVKKQLKNKENGRYSKHDPLLIRKHRFFEPILLPRSVWKKSEEDYFAIYEGEKRNKLIGKGGFSKVKADQHVDTGKVGVLKIQSIDEKKQASHQIERVKKENEILKELKFSEGEVFFHKSKEGIMKSFIPMQYIEGRSILDVLVDQESKAIHLSEVECLEMVIKGTEALLDFFEKGYYHRDIKPQNILYDEYNRAMRLTDYAFSIMFDDKTGKVTAEKAGTRYYMAPALLKEYQETKRCTYSEKSEVYSWGKTIQEIAGFSHYRKEGIPGKERYYYHLSGLHKSKRIKKFVDKMVDPALIEQPTYREILLFFTEMRNIYLKKRRMESHRIGILNIAEFEKSDSVLKSRFIQALKKMDEVILVDTNIEEKRDRPRDKVRKILVMNGIAVCERVFVSNDKETLIVHAKSFFMREIEVDEEENSPLSPLPMMRGLSGPSESKESSFDEEKSFTRSNSSQNEGLHFYYFHQDHEKCNITDQNICDVSIVTKYVSKSKECEKAKEMYFVSDDHIRKVSDAFHCEIDRLTKKYTNKLDKHYEEAKERIHQLNLSIDRLEDLLKRKELTYTSLFEELRKLSSKMYTANKHCFWKPKNMSYYTLSELTQDIEKTFCRGL